MGLLQGTISKARMQEDEGTVRSWRSSCAALCDIAFHQLLALSKLSDMTQQSEAAQHNLISGKEQPQMAAVTSHAVSPPPQQGALQQKQEQHQERQGQHEQRSTDPQGALGGATEVWMDAHGAALLPVMSAAALQLAYGALTCVRLMRTKVFTSGWAGQAGMFLICAQASMTLAQVTGALDWAGQMCQADAHTLSLNLMLGSSAHI
jgi:hypothetical protein